MIRSPHGVRRPGAYAFSGGIVSAGGSIVKTVIVLLLLASAWGWTVIAESWFAWRSCNRARQNCSRASSGLPVTDIAESFAKTSANDPLLQIYQAMVDEQARSADLIYTEGQRISCKIACIASRCWRVRARSIICRRVCRGSRPSAPSRPSWPVRHGLGHHELVPGHRASNNTSLAVVAPGIAEALFATALGLVAAIPAVISTTASAATSALWQASQRFIGVFEVELSVSFQGREIAMAFALRKHDSEFESQPIADINVTPLVDVMLVLLIVFMVAAPLMTSEFRSICEDPGQAAQRPEAADRGQRRRQWRLLRRQEGSDRRRRTVGQSQRER